MDFLHLSEVPDGQPSMQNSGAKVAETPNRGEILCVNKRAVGDSAALRAGGHLRLVLV